MSDRSPSAPVQPELPFPEVSETRPAHARRDDLDTSHDAAVKVKAATHRYRVFGLFALLGAMTDEELAEEADLRYLISPQSARSRRAELVDDDLVGIVSVAQTRRGNRCYVFDLTDSGRREAQRRGLL